MKDISNLFSIWDSGQFFGDNRSNGIVTIEEDWWLNKTGRAVGTSKKGPFRYYQCEANDQAETVLPNVVSISIDRSLDTDAAQMTLEIDNTSMTSPTAHQNGVIGDPGYYTWSRGESDDAAARWGHVTNEWNDVLTPNALLRTYQGYGGHSKSLSDAIADGNLTLTGAWMVDDVTVGTNGKLRIKCRDMAKLLIEQPIMKPLIPSNEYPLRYCRWYYKQYDASFDPRPPPNPPSGPANVAVPRYDWGSADAWYGYNASIHGHRGSDSLDGNLDTYALSVGNSHPSMIFCTDYFQYEYRGMVDQIYVHPWGGNYTMYVSVKENGVWQGTNRVPYDNTPLCATQTCTDTGADELYVMEKGIPWEQGHWHKLPRPYNASHIRITFRNHTQSQWGPWYYRCGIREFKVGHGVRETKTGVSHIPWVFGMSPHPTGEGYWCVDESGRVFPFGDAREYTKTNSFAHTSPAIAIETVSGGQGYWVLCQNGRVHSYGSGEWYGDLVDAGAGNEDYIGIAGTNTGRGYYLVRRNGTVEAYGDAVWYGNAPSSTGDPAAYSATNIETHPTLDGYWTINGDGEVTAFGSVPDYGGIVSRSGLETKEWCRGFRRTKNGDGYWIIGGEGSVHAFGTATDYGEITDGLYRNLDTLEGYRKLVWDMSPNREDDDTGYLLLQADGSIHLFGDNPGYHGNPGGSGQLREPGNYLDYSDIVKELLLWSGFHLCGGEDQPGNDPYVYGNIETTGAYADECLGEQLFDKKPVIDAINQLKEVVGYLFFVDDEGAAHFESPNWWMSGNFYQDGTHTDFIPEIDENLTLTDYTVRYADQDLRSQIIISTEEPDSGNTTTVTTKLTPHGTAQLKGMVKPALWTNGLFKNADEQRIMAELISLHIWFSTRIGNITCVANPAIQINDQVRVFERQTADTYIHYVRGVSTNHNLVTGEYTMTLDTNWLGDGDSWVITADNVTTSDLANGEAFKISDALRDWLENSGSREVEVARRSGFKSSFEFTTKTADAVIEIGTSGAADG